MRVLFDQGTPLPLRRYLTAHEVVTAAEQGWSELANGDLLRAAETDYDVFVTTDKNIRYQQNLVGRRLAILVLPGASWPQMSNHIPLIAASIEGLKAGSYQEVELP